MNKSCTSNHNLGPKVSIEEFVDHLKKLNTDLSGNTDNEASVDPKEIDHSVNEKLNVQFTISEVTSSIKKLKCNNSCGIEVIRK